MIALTAPNGDKVNINAANIIEVFPNPGTYHPKAKAVLLIGRAGGGLEHQAVTESVDEVDALIKG